MVAAGLAAGHLMGLPPGSAGRRLLAQTLRDVHRCAAQTLGPMPAYLPEVVHLPIQVYVQSLVNIVV